jgi:uncharacterized protein YggU (UPF0235/DUF167 family)
VTDLRVRVRPRGGRTDVVGERDGAVVLRVAASPVDGRANDAVCALIAERAGVPGRAVRIVAGARSRDTLVRVECVALDDLKRALGIL